MLHFTVFIAIAIVVGLLRRDTDVFWVIEQISSIGGFPSVFCIFQWSIVSLFQLALAIPSQLQCRGGRIVTSLAHNVVAQMRLHSPLDLNQTLRNLARYPLGHSLDDLDSRAVQSLSVSTTYRRKFAARSTQIKKKRKFGRKSEKSGLPRQQPRF